MRRRPGLAGRSGWLAACLMSLQPGRCRVIASWPAINWLAGCLVPGCHSDSARRRFITITRSLSWPAGLLVDRAFRLVSWHLSRLLPFWQARQQAGILFCLLPCWQATRLAGMDEGARVYPLTACVLWGALLDLLSWLQAGPQARQTKLDKARATST